METIDSHQPFEKRAAARYPVVLFVEFEHGTGWTRDVSAAGACIETDQPLACDSKVRFVLNQPDPQGWVTRVQCSGSVVWVEQGRDGWRAGVMMDAVHFKG